jgi:transposase
MSIWQKYLDARGAAIDWLKSEGLSDKEIAKSLSVDEQQVTEIRTRDRSNGAANSKN